MKPTRKRWRFENFNGTVAGILITLTGVLMHLDLDYIWIWVPTGIGKVFGSCSIA